jgi:hypothetical protein
MKTPRAKASRGCPPLSRTSTQVLRTLARQYVHHVPAAPERPSLADDVIRPINTQPCVCVMAEACDEFFQQQLLATLEPLCLDASSTVKCVSVVASTVTSLPL